jgi:1-deoxy-D-xylulose-5-phosphate synthase
VVNGRFASPVDAELLAGLARSQPFLITVEDAALSGGFGSAVLEALEGEGVSGARVIRMGVPAALVDHSSRQISQERFGLTPDGIAERVERLLHEKTSHSAW